MRALRSWMMAVVALPALACTGVLGGSEESGDGGGLGGPGPGPGPNGVGAACVKAEVGPPVLRRLSAVELESSLRDIFPEVSGAWPGVRMGPDPLSKLGFSNDAQSLQVGNQTAEELLKTAEDLATLLTQPATLGALLPCAASSPGEACAGELIGQYGLRLFRRPPSDEERAELLSLFSSVSQRSDFAKGVKWTLVAMVQSPFSIYRSEIGAPSGDRYELSQYEIATELSYTFGGTTPSAELLDKAAQGALSSEEALVEEARGLLATPGGREAMHRFLGEWLGYGRVRGKAKESVQNFAAVGELMIEETERFLDEVIYHRGAGVRELLTAPYTFVNAELSRFYGYGGASGDFEQVDRPADWGVGLLAQGAILAGNAHMDHSSPTHRGLLVYERLLCNEMPPPPANVPPIEAPEPGVSTTRARYESVHATNEACQGCHQHFDPSGFAFEHFDETGRYRADENGLAIDDSGYISFARGKETVTGAKELVETLAGDPETTACVSGLAAVYAYGGASGGECSIEANQKGLLGEEYGLLEYFARLAGTEHARFRVKQE
jgi:Protein of unknown function (DUF1588)/Protein of unknown function (DUF1592)/Protein of unknown function (DUF1595)/Protein of unknown function (DUF1587)